MGVPSDEITFTQASVVAEQIGSFVMPPVARPDTGVTLVIGSIHRDRHSVMKDIVASALKEAGYRVNDLGVDVRAADFLERLEETGSRVVLRVRRDDGDASEVTRFRVLFATSGKEDAVILVAAGRFPRRRVGACRGCQRREHQCRERTPSARPRSRHIIAGDAS